MATDPMPNPGDFFTVPDAARALDVHPETVRTAVKQGRLAGYRVFNKLLIKKLDVEAYRAAARPDGVKTAGRPRKLGPQGGENVLRQSDVHVVTELEEVVDMKSKGKPTTEGHEAKPFWVQSINPETGNMIYGAAQPVPLTSLKSNPPKPPSLMPSIGQRIAERRRFLGLSQKELAKKVGVSREMLSHFEVGRVQINASDLFHVANALAVPIAFFGESGQESADRITTDEKDGPRDTTEGLVH